jgi:ADP-ribose pyrophosphatase
MREVYMKVVHTEVLYQGKLRGIRDTLENDEGRRFFHETIQHPGAVVVLPITADGKIVCVSQYRHSLGREIIELPAGTLEASEDPLVCAGREIQEEIGMAARDWIPLGTLFPAPGFCDEIQHLFVATGLYESRAEPDEDEQISLVVMSVAEIENAILNGVLSDAKSIALFARARLRGLV